MTTPVLRVLVTDQARGVWGAQRYLLRLAPLLQSSSVELTLACPRSLQLYQAWSDVGLPAVHVDLPIERSIRKTGDPGLSGVVREGCRSVAVARQLSRVVREGAYDALWANGHWTHVDTAVAGLMSRRPVVLHLHEEAVPGAGRWMRSGGVQIANRTVAVSRAVAEGLPSAVRRRITVIPNGVDTQLMSPTENHAIRAELGIASDEIMLLAATRLDPTKRIEDLIEVMRALDDPRIRLVIAGSTSGYPEYERQVREDAASLPVGTVTFCGNRDDVVALFGASDVVVHTGTVEGMPLTVLEAQSCGKPVVAYDVAGVAEAMIDAATGVLVPPGDIGLLRDALRHLVNDAGVRTEMGLAARRYILGEHRLETQAQRNAELLIDMCGPR